MVCISIVDLMVLVCFRFGCTWLLVLVVYGYFLLIGVCLVGVWFSFDFACCLFGGLVGLLMLRVFRGG